MIGWIMYAAKLSFARGDQALHAKNLFTYPVDKKISRDLTFWHSVMEAVLLICMGDVVVFVHGVGSYVLYSKKDQIDILGDYEWIISHCFLIFFFQFVRYFY